MTVLLDLSKTPSAERSASASTGAWVPEARWLLWLTLIWLTFGLLILFSASLPVGILQYNDGSRFFVRQLLTAVLGLGLLTMICRTPLERLFQLAVPAFAVLFALVLLVKVPGLGVELNGARRWFQFGPFSLQPSELIKPCLLLIAAPLIARWPSLPARGKLISALTVGGAVGGILMQPDLGTAFLIGSVLWLMAFIGGVPLGGLLSVVAIGGAAIVWKVSNTAYQMGRVTAFLDPFKYPEGEGYQLVQSLVAVGSGGITGTGFGLSAQKATFLPYPYSDFIFAVFSEEFGLIGTASFIAFLFVFAVIGLRVAVRTAESSRRLLAAGTTLLIVGQSFFHIAVVTGSVPPKGMPLPLVSYGGSGLLASLLCCALLIRSAREMNLAPAIRFARPQNIASAPRRAPRRQASANLQRTNRSGLGR